MKSMALSILCLLLLSVLIAIVYTGKQKGRNSLLPILCVLVFAVSSHILHRFLGLGFISIIILSSLYLCLIRLVIEFVLRIKRE